MIGSKKLNYGNKLSLFLPNFSFLSKFNFIVMLFLFTIMYSLEICYIQYQPKFMQPDEF